MFTGPVIKCLPPGADAFLVFSRLWLVCLLLLPLPGRSAGNRSPSEYEVKAAMLVNFAKFVEWQQEDFASRDAPLVIGVIGLDPFGNTIDRLVERQTQGTHPFTIRRLADTNGITECQVVFITKSAEQNTGKLLGALQEKPVLTVSESEDFTRLGGHIRLYLEGNQIRFEVNVAALERSRIKMHSQVLKLAKITRDGKETSQ